MSHRLLGTLLGVGASLAAIGASSRVGAATIGHWRFEEGSADSAAAGSNTVLDSSGNGLHGTPVFGPVYRADVPALGSECSLLSLEFAGTAGQRVGVPDGPLVALTHSLTLEAFIKARPLESGTGGFGVIILRADNRAGLDPYSLVTQKPGNIVSFQIQNANQQVARLDAPIPYNQWLHVAGTLDDATGVMKLYVDRAEIASTTTAIRPLGALDPGWRPGLSFGNDYTGQYGGLFNGLIDEVRISDAALDPSGFLSTSCLGACCVPEGDGFGTCLITTEDDCVNSLGGSFAGAGTACGDDNSVCDFCPDDPEKKSAGVCGCGVPDVDTDADGLLDCQDACASSDPAATVIVDACDTGVANQLLGEGCTMADRMAELAGAARNHGAFVIAVAELTDEWKNQGLITGDEKGQIQRCAAQADLP